MEKNTYDRVLAEVIVGSSRYRIQLHQVLKVADFSLHPFLQSVAQVKSFHNISMVN